MKRYRLLLPIVASLLTGCAAVPVGKLDWQVEVTRMFREGRIVPGHDYYAANSIRSREPTVVLALDRRYQLVSRFWRRIELSEASIGALLTTLHSERPACTYRGAVVLTPKGRPAGYWYGKWNVTSIREPEPGKLIVFSPSEPGSGPCKPSPIR